MLVYIIILLLLCASSCISVFLNKEVERKLFIFFSIILLLVSGLRYDIGVDYLSYLSLYQDSFEINPEINEKGFAILFHTLYRLGISYDIVSFILSFFTIYFVFKYINRYSTNHLFSILIFFTFGQFYFNTFNSVRQTLVTYAFYLLLIYIKERKFIIYSIYVIFLAFILHSTAIILIPLYFVLLRSYSFKTRIIFFILISFSTIIVIKLIEVSPYSVYLNLDKYTGDVSPTTYLLLIISCLIFIVGCISKIRSEDEVILFNLNTILISVLILSLLFQGTPIIMVTNRLSYYFSPILIVLMPICIYRMRLLSNRSIIIIVLSICFSLLCIMTLVANGEENNLIPYKTILL